MEIPDFNKPTVEDVEKPAAPDAQVNLRGESNPTIPADQKHRPDAPTLPGGPIRTRPLEINGKRYDPFYPPKAHKTSNGVEYRGGKELQGQSDKNGGAETSIQSSFTAEEEAELKLLYAESMQKDDGQAARLGVEVELTPERQELITRLIDEAKSMHRRLAAQTPQYAGFEAILTERRAKRGSFNESHFITEDPSAVQPTKILVDLDGAHIPGISAPTDVYRLYRWQSTITDLEQLYSHYTHANGKGLAAKPLGVYVRALYRFVSETTEARSATRP